MNRTSKIVKYILMPLVAIYMMNEMWISLPKTAETIQKMGFHASTGLVLTMQILTVLGMILLGAIALVDLFSLYVVLCYRDRSQIGDRMWALIVFTDKISIVLSMLMRLSIALVFIGISCIAFFAPNVRRTDHSVYILGVFFLVLAGFMAFSTIRYALYRLQQKSQEVENDREESV